MRNKGSKRFLAVAIATTMVLANSLVAFASGDPIDVTTSEGAGGTGTPSGHLPTDVFKMTVPTGTTIATFFDYTIDPERIINKMGDNAKLKNGTAVTANTDGVYFKTGENAFGSTSQALTLSVQNYIDATVTATVALDAEETDIPVVEDVAEATDAALQLGLEFGTGDTKVTKSITDEGAEAEFDIAGQTDKFEVELADGAYKLKAKSDAVWATAPIVISGKTTSAYEIAATTTAPKINVTWAVAKKVTTTNKDAVIVSSNGILYVGTSASAGLDSEITKADIDSVTINGKALTSEQFDVVANAQGAWVAVPGTSIVAIGEDNNWAAGTELTFVVAIGTDRYTAVFTQQ